MWNAIIAQGRSSYPAFSFDKLPSVREGLTGMGCGPVPAVPLAYPCCVPYARALAAALAPAMRPNTMMSVKELPPRRLAPWTPPVHSPAA